MYLNLTSKLMAKITKAASFKILVQLLYLIRRSFLRTACHLGRSEGSLDLAVSNHRILRLRPKKNRSSLRMTCITGERAAFLVWRLNIALRDAAGINHNLCHRNGESGDPREDEYNRP